MKIHDSYDRPIPSSTLHGQMEHIIWHNLHHVGTEAGFDNIARMFRPIGLKSCAWKTVHGIITTTLEFDTIISKDNEGITIQRSVHDMYPLLKDYLSYITIE